MHTARTARIRHDWEHLTRHGGSILLNALASIPASLAPLPALLRANLISSESLTVEQDRAYAQILAEVYSVPDPARILLDDVADRLRPKLARIFARRRKRRQPSLADYATADLQLLISELWADSMQQHGFRRSSADVIHALVKEWPQKNPQNPAKFGYIATNAIPGGIAAVAISPPMLMQEKTIDAVIFGRNMKRGRDLKRMSQTELGNQLGLKQPDISRYEQGDRYPRPQRRREIARILEQPPVFFLDESVLREDEQC